jgi:exo-beta-1,3-glucanase (GH17 family)
VPAGAPAADFSVVMTPFEGPPGAATCKSQATVVAEFRFLAPKSFKRYRYHGTTCNQAYMAIKAAQETDTEVFIGVFDLRNVVQETQDLIGQVVAAGGWDHVAMVALGNEDLSKGVSAAEAIALIQQGTDILRANGYQGPVVHPETPGNILANRELMCGPAAGTMLAINVFPFFNPNVAADEAGEEAARQAKQISDCSHQFSSRRVGEDVVLSEAGWPGKASRSNGAATASGDSLVRAINSMASTVRARMYFFTAFDHTWQQNFDGSFDAEDNYGMFKKGLPWDWSQMQAARTRLLHG